MNFRCLTILFLIVATFGHAAAQDDNKANANFSLPQPSDCRFSGEFIQQKQLIGLDQSLQSKGLFFHDCNIGIVWKTIDPVNETLIMQKAGKAFSIHDGVSEELKNAQSRQINQLILALMTGDKETLTTLFDIDNFDNETVLFPTNRRLKRAIKSINVSTSINNDQPSMVIQMIDNNDQTTQIKSTILQVFSDDPHSLQANCLQTENIEIIDCGLLHAP